MAHARAQDVAEVLDEHYVPMTGEESEIFTIKQDFMYSVFNWTVQTDTGKTIVRKHEADGDDQQIYVELVKEATKSTEAQIEITEKTWFLTTSKLDSSWKGTTVGYIRYWQGVQREFEELTPTADHYSDAVKRRMLESLVEGIPDLQQVKTVDENCVATREAPMDYEAYVNVLISAAAQRDKCLGLKVIKNASTKINSTRFNFSGGEEMYFNYGYVEGGYEYAKEEHQTFQVHSTDMQSKSKVA